jgi:hypothetical protein
MFTFCQSGPKESTRPKICSSHHRYFVQQYVTMDMEENVAFTLSILAPAILEILPLTIQA